MRPLTRSLAHAIPAASVQEIDGTAHAVPFDAPGNFAQIITEAMRSAEVRSGAGARPGEVRDAPAPHGTDSVRAGGNERCM
jgi:hypothetical protein